MGVSIDLKSRQSRIACLYWPFDQVVAICVERTGFIVPVLWMGLVVSLLATLLLYRLIARGNLVNVTSLFYLVPAVTAVMDYLIFGNRLAMLSMLGMLLIIVGLVFVFRKSR